MKPFLLKIILSSSTIYLPMIVASNILVYAMTGDNSNVADTSTTVTTVENLLLQLELFINQYENFITQNNISVITANGSLSIEVNSNISDSIADLWTTRIHILDSLINTRVDDIREHLNELISLQQNGSIDNSVINNLTNNLTRLINRYGHIM